MIPEQKAGKKCIWIDEYTRIDGTKVEAHTRCYDLADVTDDKRKKVEELKNKIENVQNNKPKTETDISRGQEETRSSEYEGQGDGTVTFPLQSERFVHNEGYRDDHGYRLDVLDRKIHPQKVWSTVEWYDADHGKAEAAIRKHFPDAHVDREIFELSDPQDFHDLISIAQKKTKWGASVEVKSIEDYAKARLFVTPDGEAGFALMPDGDLTSVFSTPNPDKKKRAAQLLTLAIEQGATKMDSFNTVLPHYYIKFGFVPVARMEFNDDYAPEGWDYGLYKNFNKGRPDVLFYAWRGGERTRIIENIDTFGEAEPHIIAAKKFGKTEYEEASSYRDSVAKEDYDYLLSRRGNKRVVCHMVRGYVRADGTQVSGYTRCQRPRQEPLYSEKLLDTSYLKGDDKKRIEKVNALLSQNLKDKEILDAWNKRRDELDDQLKIIMAERIKAQNRGEDIQPYIDKWRGILDKKMNPPKEVNDAGDRKIKMGQNIREVLAEGRGKKTLNIKTTSEAMETDWRIQDGIKFTNGFVHDKWKTEDPVEIHYRKGVRANYNSSKEVPRIEINPNKDGGGVVAHEITHHIEEKNPELLRRAVDYHNSRLTEYDEEISLQSISFNYAYREKAKTNKFGEDFYAGKIYKAEEVTFRTLEGNTFVETTRTMRPSYRGRYATEILTVGIQRFYEDPSRFINRNKDFADFIIKTLYAGN